MSQYIGKYNRLDKKIRNGCDVTVIFSTYEKKEHNMNMIDSVKEKISPRLFIKRIARFVFRICKPEIKIICQKLRSYMMEDILNTVHDIQHTIYNIESNIISLSLHNRRIPIAVSGETGEKLIRSSIGYVIVPTYDYALLVYLMESYIPEPGTQSLLNRILNPGDKFVDIGANVGMMSLAAARALKGKGLVIAFEPFEETARLLMKTMYINGFSSLVEIHNVAVSQQNGRALLHLGTTCSYHSLYPLKLHEQFMRPAVEVETVSLDEAMAGRQVHVLKIDVEGAELDVLAGAQQTLAANPEVGLIVKFGPSHLRRIGVSPEAWFAAFAAFGFTWRAINETDGTLFTSAIEDMALQESVNLFFARPEAKIWKRAVGAP